MIVCCGQDQLIRFRTSFLFTIHKLFIIFLYVNGANRKIKNNIKLNWPVLLFRLKKLNIKMITKT